MISITQNLIITNTKKDLKISKHKFNRYGGQVGSCISEKNISTVCMWGNLILDSLDVGLTCPTFRKFEIFGQVVCRTYDIGIYKSEADSGGGAGRARPLFFVITCFLFFCNHFQELQTV